MIRIIKARMCVCSPHNSSSRYNLIDLKELLPLAIPYYSYTDIPHSSYLSRAIPDSPEGSVDKEPPPSHPLSYELANQYPRL